MHGLISRLVAQHSVETCEAALVSAFLHDAGLRVRRNRALVGLLEAAPGDTLVAMSLIRSERCLELDDLVFAFEALIPASERRNHGTVFTPRPIAEYLAERTITANTTSILDPACGCGALLMAAARRAAAITGRSLAEVATDNLHGVDLRADNIRRARLLLGLMCLHAGEDTPDAGTHLAVGNSLTFEYAAAFPRMQAAGGFSAIVGNPPYVRFQDLDDATRRQLSAWPGGADGNPNLYFAFFPLGRSLLAPTGRLAYISPNSFFHLRSARGLRTWLGDTGFVHEVIDFGDTLVFDALAYTAITICAPTPARTVTYRTNPTRNVWRTTGRVSRSPRAISPRPAGVSAQEHPGVSSNVWKARRRSPSAMWPTSAAGSPPCATASSLSTGPATTNKFDACTTDANT